MALPYTTQINGSSVTSSSTKDNGGVIFVNFYPGFIDSTFFKKEQDLKVLHSSLIDSVDDLYGKNSTIGYYKKSELLRPY